MDLIDAYNSEKQKIERQQKEKEAIIAEQKEISAFRNEIYSVTGFHSFFKAIKIEKNLNPTSDKLLQAISLISNWEGNNKDYIYYEDKVVCAKEGLIFPYLDYYPTVKIYYNDKFVTKYMYKDIIYISDAMIGCYVNESYCKNYKDYNNNFIRLEKSNWEKYINNINRMKYGSQRYVILNNVLSFPITCYDEETGNYISDKFLSIVLFEDGYFSATSYKNTFEIKLSGNFFTVNEEKTKLCEEKLIKELIRINGK